MTVDYHRGVATEFSHPLLSEKTFMQVHEAEASGYYLTETAKNGSNKLIFAVKIYGKEKPFHARVNIGSYYEDKTEVLDLHLNGKNCACDNFWTNEPVKDVDMSSRGIKS